MLKRSSTVATIARHPIHRVQRGRSSPGSVLAPHWCYKLFVVKFLVSWRLFSFSTKHFSQLKSITLIFAIIVIFIYRLGRFWWNFLYALLWRPLWSRFTNNPTNFHFSLYIDYQKRIGCNLGYNMDWFAKQRMESREKSSAYIPINAY